jgi:hypothetical protein
MYNKMLTNYYKPTPVKWRKLGDALLAVSTTVTTYAIVEDYKWIALAAVLIVGSWPVSDVLSQLFPDLFYLQFFCCSCLSHVVA